MKNKMNSLRFRILITCIVTAMISSLMFGIYGAYNVLKYRSDFLRTNELLIEVYADELNKDIRELDSYINMLLSGDSNFALLETGRLKDLWQVREEYNLHNTIKSKAGSMNRSGGVFYYNKNTDTLRSAFSSQYDNQYKYTINQELSVWLGNHAGISMEEIAMIQDEKYYIRMVGQRGCFVGYFVNLTDYFSETMAGESFQLVLTDTEGNIVEYLGREVVAEEELAEAMQVESTNGFRYVVVSVGTSIDINIVMIRPYWSYLRFWQDARFWIFMVVIPCVAIVPFLILYRYFKMLMVIPTDRILSRIRKQEIEVCKGGQESNIIELKELEDKIDEMIHESVHLQQDVYEARMEKERARFQGYLLQIKPHFYLNCLKSLDASLEAGDVDRARVFIYQLSNYLRLRFGRIEDTHRLEDELSMVHHYYCLITLISTDPLLFVMPEELADKNVLVPTFCIQTFVENSVKYAKETNKILKVEIAISEVKEEADEYLVIRISDNGNGFEKDQLRVFNSEEIRIEAVGGEHIGIKNLSYRIKQLYGEKGSCVFYNAPSGGAVVEMLMPKEKQE